MTTDPTKLADWLAIRDADPEAWERICEAAGMAYNKVDSEWPLWTKRDDPEDERPIDDSLPQYAVAALAHGASVVLEEDEEDFLWGWNSAQGAWILEWWSGDQRKRYQLHFPTLAHALLAACRRVWCEGVGDAN